MAVPTPFLLLFAVTALFGFLDGFHNSANVVATVISSRAMRAREAIILAAVAGFIGPFLFGVAVAKTIGRELVDPALITTPIIITAMLAAVIWKIATWWRGIPASSSHSLLGGLVGAIIIGSGASALRSEGLVKIVAALVLSPLLGLLAGYLVMKVALFLLRGASPSINMLFKRGQLLTAILLGLSHGTSHAQRTMGILALGLVTTGLEPSFVVPWWVVASSAGVMALGTLMGGERIIRTLGGKFYKIRPIHAFMAQATAGTVTLVAAVLGGPVSTTEVISSAILGVGSAERLSKVRWQVFYEIGLAWVLTLPATVLMAIIFYQAIRVLVNVLAAY